MIVFMKKNILVIIVTLALGLIYYAPNILIPFLLKQDGASAYHPLNLEAPILDEVGSYGVKIRDIMDGNWRDGDPYIYEHKNKSSIWGNYYLSLLTGTVLKYLGANDPTPLYTIGDFLFPGISFLIVFYLLYQITRHRAWSTFGGVVVVAFPNVKAAVNAFLKVLHGSLGADTIFKIGEAAFNENITRILVPAVALPFLLLFFVAFFKLLEKQTWRRAIFFSITLGALFYTYSYHLIFALFAMATCGLVLLLSRKWKTLLSVVMASLAALAVGAAGIYKLYTVTISPDYAKIRDRLGIIVGRNFDFGSLDNLIFLIIFLLIFVFAWRKKILAAPIFIFAFSLLAATFEVLNLQVITGFNPQPDHWGSRVSIYILTLALVLMIFYLFKIMKMDRAVSAVSVIALAFLFLSALLYQIKFSINSRYEYISSPEILRSFDWINKNIPARSVIATPSGKMMTAIPFFTHADTYYAYINFTLAPSAEVRERFFEALRIYNVSDDFFLRAVTYRFDLSKTGSADNLHGVQIEPFFGLYGSIENDTILRTWYDASVGRELAVAYAKQPPKTGKNLITKYKADYLYYGLYEKLLSDLKPERFENLELVYNDNLVQIFRIIK